MRRYVIGQAAMEYMVIIILVLLFLIPVWNYVSTAQSSTSTHLSATYAKNAADRLAETAGFVDSQGPPARIIVKVYVPKDVESVTFTNNTIIFRVRSGDSYSDIFSQSTAGLNGTLPIAEGNYRVAVQATAGDVQIYPVQ